MTKTSFWGLDLVVSLAGALSQVMNIQSLLVSSEVTGDDRSPLLRLSPVDRGRLGPALIPIRVVDPDRGGNGVRSKHTWYQR
jgi:hypothetical protein